MEILTLHNTWYVLKSTVRIWNADVSVILSFVPRCVAVLKWIFWPCSLYMEQLLGEFGPGNIEPSVCWTGQPAARYWAQRRTEPRWECIEWRRQCTAPGKEIKMFKTGGGTEPTVLFEMGVKWTQPGGLYFLKVCGKCCWKIVNIVNKNICFLLLKHKNISILISVK